MISGTVGKPTTVMPGNAAQRPQRVAARLHTPRAADRSRAPVPARRVALALELHPAQILPPRRQMRALGQAEQLAGGAGGLDRRDRDRTREAQFVGIGVGLVLRRVRQPRAASPRTAPSAPRPAGRRSRGRSASRPIRAARSGRCPCGWCARPPRAYSASMRLARIRKRTPSRTAVLHPRVPQRSVPPPARRRARSRRAAPGRPAAARNRRSRNSRR